MIMLITSTMSVVNVVVCKFVGDVNRFGALTGLRVSRLWLLCDNDCMSTNVISFAQHDTRAGVTAYHLI